MSLTALVKVASHHPSFHETFPIKACGILPNAHQPPHLSLSRAFPFGTMSMYERVSSKVREQKKKFILWACAISIVIILSTALSLTTIKQAGAKPKALASSPHSFSTVSRAAAAATTASTAATTTKTSSAITSACEATHYPNACESALASIAGAPTKSAKDLFDVSVQFAMGHAHSVRSMAYNLTLKHQKLGSGHPTGMDDCLELLDITLDQLNDVLDPKKSSSPHDIKTWLSAALTNQATCKDSLQTVEASDGRDAMSHQVESLAQFISNSLALHNNLKGGKDAGGRKLLSDGFPSWLSAADRKLLEASPEDIRADAVVAKDGSGTHKTINEAIAFASLATSGGGGRSVIYVKSGTYNEYIKIPTKQKNVMLMGDGKGKSVIVGSRNVENGYTTYGSATVGEDELSLSNPTIPVLPLQKLARANFYVTGPKTATSNVGSNERQGSIGLRTISLVKFELS